MRTNRYQSDFLHPEERLDGDDDFSCYVFQLLRRRSLSQTRRQRHFASAKFVEGARKQLGFHLVRRCMRPLPDAHPELEVIDNLPLSIEYRVHNYSRAKKGSNRLHRRHGLSLRDVALFFASVYAWRILQVRTRNYREDVTDKGRQYPLVGGLLLVMLAHTTCTQLLWGTFISVHSNTTDPL